MLLRHLHILLTSMALALAAAACSDDEAALGGGDPGQALRPGQPGTLTLRLTSAPSARSTASANAENLIDNLLVCLYPTTAGDDDAATVVASFSNLQGNGSTEVTMMIPDDAVATLFGDAANNGTCSLMALANIPADDLTKLAASNPTRTQLTGLSISSNFKEVKEQTSFVMITDGTAVVNYVAPTTGTAKGTATGDAKLFRAAAKINLNIKLPTKGDGYIEIKSDDGAYTDADGNKCDHWYPETKNMRVHINKGVQSAIAAPVGAAESSPQYWKPSADAAYYDGDFSTANSVRTLTLNSSSSDADIKALGDADYNYVMDVPFYSYPNAWEESPSEAHKTTLTLLVPFKKNNESSWHNYYYQVPVTGGTAIERNHHYIVNLSVGMLGSLAPDEPLEVTDCSYLMVDWGSADVTADLQEYRYLIASPDEVDVNNEESVRIPIYSSHPFEVADVTMSFTSFNYFIGNNNGTTVNFTFPKSVLDASNKTASADHQLYSATATFASSSSTAQASNLTFSHPLEIWTPVNSATATSATTSNTVSLTYSESEPTTDSGRQEKVDATVKSVAQFIRPTSPEAPFCVYTFTVTLRHTDKPDYTETVTIKQYPAMYIENKPNAGTASSGNLSYVYVNGNNSSGSDNNKSWYHITSTFSTSGSTSSASNNNPNMYVISITNLDTSSLYTIGDPRMMYADNTISNQTTTGTGWQQTTTENALDTRTTDDDAATSSDQTSSWCYSTKSFMYDKTKDTSRPLKYYYPTREDDATKMVIAPKLRIASSHGKCPAVVNRTNARRRIATYQEVDCPAGRWRLPTYGELLFIVTLSQQGKIPTLFNEGQNYWTAQGLYKVNAIDNADGVLTLETYKQNGSNYVRGVYDEWYWEESGDYATIGLNDDGYYDYTLGDVPRSVIGK